MTDDTTYSTTPGLTPITGGLHVQKVDQFLRPPERTSLGMISIGPDVINGDMSVVHIGLTLPDGETVVATLGPQAWHQFALRAREVADMLNAGWTPSAGGEQ